MIRFDEATHRYFDGEKQLISVTQLMRKHGLSPDYSAVRSDVLQAKAERGSLIHKEIDDFIKKGEIGFTREVGGFARIIKEREIDIIDNEFIIYNDVCAGTADLLLRDRTGFLIIADIKTTATLHRDAVSWQLSIYNALDGWKANKAQAYHFNADGELNVVDIPLKTREEVESLFECERNGEIYKPAQIATIDEKQLKALANFERIIAEAEAQKKAAEQQRDEIKAALIAAMEERGVKTFETDNIRLTYVAPSTRATIDTARLKKELPEVAEQYTKTSETKASLRITIKEQ
jgi:hypothetical protein